MTLKSSEVLSKAADLIEPEGAWTKGNRARDSRGISVEPDNERAVCWCIVGAVQRIQPFGPDPYEHPSLDWVRRVVRWRQPSMFNDHPRRAHAGVVSALRKAAELARSEGQ